MKKQYLEFNDAKRFVHELKFTRQIQWIDYCKSGNKPENIPYHPDRTYKNLGWRNFGDWLGTGRISNRDKKFRSFLNARKYVHALKLNTDEEWRKFSKTSKKPDDIPSAPWQTYKSEWKNIRDWLGTKRPSLKKKYREFHLAKQFIHSLIIKNQKEWKKYTKSKDFPPDIPKAPHYAYSDLWISWGDWFGTGFVAHKNRNYRTFDEARKYAQSLNLKTIDEWFAHTKSKDFPSDLPVYPDKPYQNTGWKGWGDFIHPHYINPKNRIYTSYEDARKFIQKLGLKNQKEWFAYTKSQIFPSDLPVRPYVIYKNKGWISFDDFLGHGRISNVNKKFKTFSKSRQYVHKLGIQNQKEWLAFTKTKNFPDDLPTSPWEAYKNKGWTNLDDFLGHGRITKSSIKYKSFNDARFFAQTNKIKTASDWAKLLKSNKLMSNLPVRPDKQYADQGWTTWGDFLGTGRISDNLKKFRTFHDTRNFARLLGLKTVAQWQKYAGSKQRPKDVPSSPPAHFGKEWTSWGDFLGTKNISFKERSEKWLPWKEAKPLYQKIRMENKISNYTAWLKYVKTHKLPKGLPPYPDGVYTIKRAEKLSNNQR